MAERIEGVPIAVAAADGREWLRDAVSEGGAVVAEPSNARGLVWGAPDGADDLRRLLNAHPQIEWVQLPWSGIEAFRQVLDDERRWTAAQGVYAQPVAEHALTLALAGMRGLHRYAKVQSWSGPIGRNLLGARVTVLGGGGIARAFVELLEPFDCDVVIIRKRPEFAFEGARVYGLNRLAEILTQTDLLLLALALTPETKAVIDARTLAALPSHAWIVNVARGEHIEQDALVQSLRDGAIGGAALDVTSPEPLPDDHPLWSLPNTVITPHVANTPAMARPLLHRHVVENVRRFVDGQPLKGLVSLELGY